MPFIVITLVLAVILGLWAPRRWALAVTGAAAIITVFGHIWAVADGKGNDPWWEILIGVAGSLLALAICDRLSAARLRRAGQVRTR
jgi:hypothetical protein